MMRYQVHRYSALVTLVVGVGWFGWMPGRADAQYGGGFGGFGWGWGGAAFHQAPSPTNFINQATLARIGRVQFGPQQNNPYAGNSNAYFNHSMDNGFVDRYRADRREPSYSSTQYTAARAPQEAPAPPPTARAQPNLPLGSFYKADDHIEWPSDSPSADGLREKRDEFDKVSKDVLAEIKKTGVASIASVSEARKKLLDYGRPALQYARANQTARVADTFHLFLLALYDSLGQATNPTSPAPKPDAAAAGVPPG